MGLAVREHAIDHLRRHAEIVRGIGEAIDGGAIEMHGNFRHFRQHVGERAALLVDGSARAVHDIVRALASQVRRETHHHGFCDDEARGKVEILAPVEYRAVAA